MRKEDFYRKYSNTPIPLRSVRHEEYGMTLQEIYTYIHNNDEDLYRIKKDTDNLLVIAGNILK